MEGASSSTIMLVVLIAVFYFMLIRPENKRKKKAQEMRDSLKKGDTITTIGGIVGKIVMVKPDTIVIETSDDRVRMELTKWAVSTTGVAGPGPDGDKPAGLVYVGLRIPASLTADHAEVLKAVELHLDGMREEIRRLTVFHVLQNLSLFTASFKE